MKPRHPTRTPLIDRRTLLLSLAGAGVGLRGRARAAQFADRGIDRLRVADIAGAVYAPDQRTFSLLVRPAAADEPAAEIFVDQVIHLTRIALAGLRAWSFSLDFERIGTRPFRAGEVGGGWRLVRRLAARANPIDRYVADLLPADLFAEAARATPMTPVPGRARRALADALDRARRDPLVARLALDGTTPQAAAAIDALASLAPRDRERLARLAIEDHFSGFVTPDIGPHYVIAYLADHPAIVRRTLTGSRLERLLLDGDLFLKQAANAIDLPEDLALGASQLVLCQLAIEEALASGDVEALASGSFVLNFNLEAARAYPRELGLGFLFEEARLVIRDGVMDPDAEVPACVQRFTGVLNRTLSNALRHPGAIGQTLRSMRAIMLLNQVIHWGLDLFLPVDAGIVEGYPTPTFAITPPRLREFPALVAHDGGIAGVVYRGGVRFTSGTAARAADPQRAAAATQPAAARRIAPAAPGFVAAPAPEADGLLRVDIGSIVGL